LENKQVRVAQPVYRLGYGLDYRGSILWGPCGLLWNGYRWPLPWD